MSGYTWKPTRPTNIYPHWIILPEFCRRASHCVYVNPTEDYEKIVKTSRVGTMRKRTRMKGKGRARRRGRGGARGRKGGNDKRRKKLKKNKGEKVRGK